MTALMIFAMALSRLASGFVYFYYSTASASPGFSRHGLAVASKHSKRRRIFLSDVLLSCAIAHSSLLCIALNYVIFLMG